MKIFVLTFFPDQHSEDKSVQLVRVSFVPKYLTSYKIHTLKKAGLADLILLIVATWSDKHFVSNSELRTLIWSKTIIVLSSSLGSELLGRIF